MPSTLPVTTPLEGVKNGALHVFILVQSQSSFDVAGMTRSEKLVRELESCSQVDGCDVCVRFAWEGWCASVCRCERNPYLP